MKSEIVSFESNSSRSDSSDLSDFSGFNMTIQCRQLIATIAEGSGEGNGGGTSDVVGTVIHSEGSVGYLACNLFSLECSGVVMNVVINKKLILIY